MLDLGLSLPGVAVRSPPVSEETEEAFELLTETGEPLSLDEA